MADTKNRVMDKAKQAKEYVQDMPTQARYAIHSTKEKAKENVADVKRGIVDTKDNKQKERVAKAQQRKENIADKRMAIQKASEEKRNGSVKRHEKSGTAQTHERANMKPYKKSETHEGTPTYSQKVERTQNTNKEQKQRSNIVKPPNKKKASKRSKQLPKQMITKKGNKK